MVYHRQEVMTESTQRKNILTAICDALFPVLVQIFRDSHGLSALVFRDRFPTPTSVTAVSPSALQDARGTTRRLSDETVLEWQSLVPESICTTDAAHQHGWERQHVLEECRRITASTLEALETEMR